MMTVMSAMHEVHERALQQNEVGDHQQDVIEVIGKKVEAEKTEYRTNH